MVVLRILPCISRDESGKGKASLTMEIRSLPEPIHMTPINYFAEALVCCTL